MTRTLLVMLLLTVMLLPGAAAWPWDPLEIDVPALRTGDLLQIELDDGSESRLILVEGPSQATDRFGIARATNAYREDEFEQGSYVRSTRCHEAAGTIDLVRADVIGGDPMGWSTEGSDGSTFSTITGTRETELNLTTTATFWGSSCFLDRAAGPLVLREGATYRLGDMVAEANEVPAFADVMSLPAASTRTGERDAIAITFDITDAWAEGEGELPTGATVSFVIVWAEGIPVPIQETMRAEGIEGAEPFGLVLAGFTPGTGAPVARSGGEQIPDRHPTSRFVPYDAMRIDTAALGLALSFEDAFAALDSDTRAGFASWSQAHPNAHLQFATYAPTSSERLPGMTETTPGWQLRYQDDAEAHAWLVVQREAVPGGLGAGVLPPQSTIQVTDLGANEPVLAGQAMPVELIPSETVLALARAEGMAEPIQRLTWFVSAVGDEPFVVVTLDDVDRSGDASEGHGVQLDPVRGALQTAGVGTFTATTTGGLLPQPSERIEPAGAQGSAMGALPSPAKFATGAAATATALGLLALLLKFVLLPLYSRLRRDRLLDNEVRARLYERVRREPGIHRAELIDYAGIGEGATRHHLAQLVSHRLLVETEVDGFARYFAAGEVPPDVARRESVLRAGSQRAVYELFAGEPHLSLRDAAARLGMSAPSVHRAKKKLERAGLLPAAASAQVAEA